MHRRGILNYRGLAEQTRPRVTRSVPRRSGHDRNRREVAPAERSRPFPAFSSTHRQKPPRARARRGRQEPKESGRVRSQEHPWTTIRTRDPKQQQMPRIEEKIALPCAWSLQKAIRDSALVLGAVRERVRREVHPMARRNRRLLFVFFGDSARCK